MQEERILIPDTIDKRKNKKKTNEIIGTFQSNFTKEIYRYSEQEFLILLDINN